MLPFDIVATLVNPLLRQLCPNSQMILMKLYAPDANTDSPSEYMKQLRLLVKELPPILLMNSSTHLPVITRYI